jgi:CHAT domain-containing protein
MKIYKFVKFINKLHFMKIKYAPLLLCILYVMNCNNSSPNPIPHQAAVVVSHTFIDGIPLKYNRIWSGKVDSVTAQDWHSRGVNVYENAPDTAIDYFEKAFLIRHQLNQNHWTTAKTAFNLGGVYNSKRDFATAQIIFEKALAIIKQLPYLPVKEKLKGDIYIELGNAYMETADIQQALQSYKAGLFIYDSLQKAAFKPRIQTSDYIVAYLGLLNYYKEVNQLDSFNHYLNQYKKSIDLNEIGDVIKYEIPQGSMYRKQKQYDKSVALLQRVTQYAQDADLGGAHIELAKTYLEMNELLKARESVEKGIQIWQSAGENGSIRDLIEGYTLSGKIYEAQGNKKRALDEYKKVAPNPGYGWISLEPLHRKAVLTENKDTAFKCYKDLTDMIVSIRYQLKREDEKLIWKDRTRVICENALENAYDLYKNSVEQRDKTAKFKYLNRIINLFAQNKAILLSEEWSKMDAKHIAGIPDSLIQVEKQLYSALASAQKNKSSELEKAYNALHAFQAVLKQEYGNYYESKYGDLSNNKLNINELQKKLDNKTCLLEYFWGKELYVLAMDQSQYVLKTISTDSLESKIRMVRHLSGNAKEKYFPKEQKDTLADLAYQLNERLVRPVLAPFKGVKRLQIVKDSLINLVVFETLLTDNQLPFSFFKSAKRICAKWTDNKPQITESEPLMTKLEAPLLLRKYAISYPLIHYQTLRAKTQSVDNQQDFGAITFNYATSDTNNQSIAHLGKVKSLSYLPKKIQAAADTLFPNQSNVWLNKAHFSDMQRDFNKYRMFVLGMHARGDLNTTDSCALQFPDTNVPFADIVGLNGWKTQLLFLAACQTGEGRYVEGVGVMSLSYGFAFAGCRSIVESAWGVDEIKTSDILYSFLEHLKKGVPKDIALQQAKLTYLANQDEDSDQLLPVHWAGLNLKGDIDPIQFDSVNDCSILSYMLAGVLLLLTIYAYRRYRLN